MLLTSRNRMLPLLSLLLLLCGGADTLLRAQVTNFSDIRPKLNSPLSRFGLGNPVDQFFAAQGGMGGMESTFQNAFHLNIENPAALASLQSTSFEVGGFGRYANLADRTSEASTWQGNIRYISLGFPLRNPYYLAQLRQQNSWNGGMAFTLRPTTNVGYDLEILGNSADFGRTSNLLRGNGGTYRFTWSTALRLRTLSLGANVNYNFGKITNSRVVTFDDVSEALASELTQDLAIGGFSLGYGLQYVYNFKSPNDEGELRPNGKRFIVGANGNLGRELDTDASVFFNRFSPNNQLAVRDTLRSETGRTGRLTLPSSYSVGLAFENVNKFFVGVEYGNRAYGQYRNSEAPETLQDARRIALGVQYIPNASSYNRFLQRVRYRAGLRLEEDGRSVDGVQARRNAVTLGLGLPFRLPRQQVSFVDLAFEFGKFGVPEIIDENYFQFTIGFSLNDNSWFFKRKLN